MYTEGVRKKYGPGGADTPRNRGPQKRRVTVDERILAQRAQHSPANQEQKVREERRSCFYRLEGWVFLGSISYDGEEVYAAIRCKSCDGTAVLERS